jgi:hypothetical protein
MGTRHLTTAAPGQLWIGQPRAAPTAPMGKMGLSGRGLARPRRGAGVSKGVRDGGRGQVAGDQRGGAGRGGGRADLGPPPPPPWVRALNAAGGLLLRAAVRWPRLTCAAPSDRTRAEHVVPRCPREAPRRLWRRDLPTPVEIISVGPPAPVSQGAGGLSRSLAGPTNRHRREPNPRAHNPDDWETLVAYRAVPSETHGGEETWATGHRYSGRSARAAGSSTGCMPPAIAGRRAGRGRRWMSQWPQGTRTGRTMRASTAMPTTRAKPS